MEMNVRKFVVATPAVLAATGFLFIQVASAADLGGGSKDGPSGFMEREASASNFWSGFYISGQIGYGISTQTLTGLSTENFDATPSRCFKQTDVNSTGVEDEDGGLHDIGIIGGISFTNVSEQDCVDELDVDAHSVTTETVSEHSDSGLVGGVRVGADYSIGRFIVGAFGEYNWSDIDGKDHDWALAGRLGYVVASRTMVYGLLGYAQADYGDVTFEGIRAGAGVEFAVTSNFFLGMEYAHTWYDEETLIDTPLLNVKGELDEDRIMATAKIKFNGGLLD